MSVVVLCGLLFSTIFASMYTEIVIKAYKIVYSSIQVTKSTLTQSVKQYQGRVQK